ncbi:MAG TPA: hypothetical protein PLQ35_06270 [bacterium]|nr:hypothetical protein [bacterium]HQL61881.1 hypothetical protein [bacterium]
MSPQIERREFIQLTLSTGAVFLGGLSLAATGVFADVGWAKHPALISPGCRKSKVKVAKIYMGKPKALWPTPTLDLEKEVQAYDQEFKRMEKEFADVEFVTDQLVGSVDDVKKIQPALDSADGILAIQLSMQTRDLLDEILARRKPTALFAVPYSGHEWVGFGALQKQEAGELTEFFLTSDYDQLAVAIRPFRAIHHLREAKILNVTENKLQQEYVDAVKSKFATEVVRVDRDRVLAAYEAVSDNDARAEAKQWIERAVQVVEPDEDEIFRSCKLALAFENLLDEEEATVITVDCYGSMYRKLPAFPCIGFTRLNDMGLAGICESDLRSAMTFILFQGLVGKPGFISDPTMDVSKNAAILAHCLGTRRMDGPGGGLAPYKLRTIMERQEGAVPQVKMRVGEKVTQAILVDPNQLLYFTGTIIDVPEPERGCRTKITVQVDGDAEELWKNWTHGLHRVTCYGDIAKDLKRFCRYQKVECVAEV